MSIRCTTLRNEGSSPILAPVRKQGLRAGSCQAWPRAGSWPGEQDYSSGQHHMALRVRGPAWGGEHALCCGHNSKRHQNEELDALPVAVQRMPCIRDTHFWSLVYALRLWSRNDQFMGFFRQYPIYSTPRKRFYKSIRISHRHDQAWYLR